MRWNCLGSFERNRVNITVSLVPRTASARGWALHSFRLDISYRSPNPRPLERLSRLSRGPCFLVFLLPLQAPCRIEDTEESVAN